MLNLLRIDNPIWSRELGWNQISVHLLGGRCLADTPEGGVTDHKRGVFHADDGIHEGLYVIDGSVLPRSLGVNSSI